MKTATSRVEIFNYDAMAKIRRSSGMNALSFDGRDSNFGSCASAHFDYKGRDLDLRGPHLLEMTHSRYCFKDCGGQDLDVN